MIGSHLNLARRRTLQLKLTESFEQSIALIIFKHREAEAKQFAKPVNKRPSCRYLAVRKPVAIPNHEGPKSNVPKLNAAMLFDQSCQFAIMLHANLMLQLQEIGIRIGAVDIDQLL